MDFEDEERVRAMIDALKHELSESWQNEVLQMLSKDEQKFAPVAAEVAGYRRLGCGRELLEALREGSSYGLPNFIWALGRLNEQDACVALHNYFLYHDDESVRSAAALALMRLGDWEAVRHCLQNDSSDTWALIPLGLGGGRSAVDILLEQAQTDQATSDCLRALGLLGDISAMDLLLRLFGNEELAESAAMALNHITGAEIYEEVFIPDEIDEDELFEEELEKFKQGEVPTRSDGQAFGITMTRLSQDPEDWQKWWIENRLRFDPNLRYRNGKPHSLTCLLENLEYEKSPRFVRQMAYGELVIRYGVDFPFETDMFVAQQKQAIAKYAEWVNANGHRFQPGKWYFAGKLI